MFGARSENRIMPMLARLPLKSALGAAALAAAGLLLTPAAASAQSYSYQGSPQSYGSYNSQYYGNDQRSGYGQRDYGYDNRAYDQSYGRSGYDSCDRRQRQGTGAAVGATFGAVVGSQLGARGRRTEGSVLGAVIGGALGAAVGGDSSRNCSNGQNGYSGHVGYGDDYRGYSDQSRYGYNDRGYSDQSRYGYNDRGYSNDQYGYSDRYDDRGYQYDRNSRDCRPVAVQSRDRYGRTVTRYQQTC